ncbi:hypothetical protein [Moheibacter lacus]|uniref:Bulb-type lectin domain-containing protein n=1 Tax=Moheibacter lacus TaxID=2745851 RepID=A0A838ZGR1_9FLAO|nr:hypothetical protein [Moheibacter lacus]MBA5628458.1 hypothetical protein [Moheibacter lacus]
MKLVFKILMSGILVWSCSNDDVSSSSDEEFANEIEFTQTLGGSKNDDARAIINTLDGGYAILGSTQSMDGNITDKNDDSYDFWLIKFDNQDSVQWTKTYGGSQNDHGFDLVQSTDGGYAILGYSQSSDGDVSENAGMSDYWIAKLDAEGNLLWEKSFGYVGGDAGTVLTPTHDGGYLLTGVLDAFASGGEGNTFNKHPGGNYWMIKLDAQGNKEWSRHYGGYFTDTAYGAIQTEDDGYIIVGSSDSYEVELFDNKGTYDVWVIKIDQNGELVWNKNFGGSGIDEARAITDSGDGNFIIIGDTRSNDQDVPENKGSADLWMIKMNQDGEILWSKTYGGTGFDVGRSVMRTSDNGYLVSGSSKSGDGDVGQNQGSNDAWILKTDSNGELLWQKSVGGTQLDFAFDAIQKPDNTIVAVGNSASSDGDISTNKGLDDLLIIKLR